MGGESIFRLYVHRMLTHGGSEPRSRDRRAAVYNNYETALGETVAGHSVEFVEPVAVETVHLVAFDVHEGENSGIGERANGFVFAFCEMDHAAETDRLQVAERGQRAVERHFGGGTVTVELAHGSLAFRVGERVFAVLDEELVRHLTNLAKPPGGVTDFADGIHFESAFGLALFDHRFSESVEFGTVFGFDTQDAGTEAVGLGIGRRLGLSFLGARTG
jgi:hypothetical protein